jgi:hypothetical protein
MVVVAGGGWLGYETTRSGPAQAVGTSGTGHPSGPGRPTTSTSHGASHKTSTGGTTAAGPGSTPGASSSGTASATTPTSVAMMDASSDVTANWVISENQRPGTTAWQIGATTGTIAGYAGQTSAQVGDTVKLYVTTDAPSFTVQAFRMGYYGGDGARLVWSSAPVPGIEQAACPVDHDTNMVSCAGWTPSLSIDITPDFVQGDYLLKLVGSGSQASYVPLTVWEPSSTAAYLVENDIYTWQAWNDYGGYDFYDGKGSCPADVYPICSRARVVSFDRPYDYGQGAADFLGNEYPLVRFMEQKGLDVTYATSANFEQNPTSILQHKVLMSLGHDECWSYPERQAAEAAEQKGVNMIFFGASAVLRHVRMEPSPLGADREEVDYRNSASDPLDGTGHPLDVTGNTWADPPASWSQVPFVGGNYTGYVRPNDKPVAFVVSEGSSWLFAGTGLTTGSSIPGLLVSDFDQVQPGVSPSNIEVLGHSPMPRSEVQSNVQDPASDATYYTDARSNAGVFDSGTVSWIPDMASSSTIDQMTANLLAVFGAGPAGLTQPSVPNWKSIYY